MYKKILVALENTKTDRSLVLHIAKLAKILNAQLLLVHVAEGWAARFYEELKLKESEEMIQDRKYLEKTANTLRKKGLNVATYLALGNPPDEILISAKKEKCDLIAMTSHGHRFLADIIYGSTIEEVRHKSPVPILVVKGHS